MIIIVFANAFANTVMVRVFNHFFPNLWDGGILCMFFIIIEFFGYAFASTASAFSLFAVLNIFNFRT